MPHVKIEGACDLRAYWEGFEPTTVRHGERILKAAHAYLSKTEDSIAVDCTVVEGFLRQNFVAQIVAKEGGALIRIFHSSQPEKTPGVRACLGWLAHSVISRNPGTRWSADNLGLAPGDLPGVDPPIPDR